MDPEREIHDDPALLDLILADTNAAAPLYRPTNYWTNHLPPTIHELRTEGLKAFRSRRGSRLGTFGGSDLRPQWRYVGTWAYDNMLTRRAPALRRGVSRFEQWLNGWFFDRALKIRAPYGLGLQSLHEAAFDAANREATLLGKKLLSSIEASTVGSPEDVFERGGKIYTWNFIGYYLRYLFAAQHIAFDRVRLLIELGPGAGTSIEVLKKLHPHLAFAVFDIPPALYVSHQYLRAVFGDDVVPYSETRDLAELGSFQPGKIYVFGSWKFPLIEPLRDYIFWNAASMQEMEPPVVANYLSYVNRGASAAYLLELMGGQYSAAAPGKHGVLEQTTFRHYEAALTNLRLVARAPARMPIGFLVEHGPYEETVWQRK